MQNNMKWANPSTPHIVGLDVHSEKTYATIIDGDGKIIGREKLANRHVPEFLRKF